jgi:hypothetical protein
MCRSCNKHTYRLVRVAVTPKIFIWEVFGSNLDTEYRDLHIFAAVFNPSKQITG